MVPIAPKVATIPFAYSKQWTGDRDSVRAVMFRKPLFPLSIFLLCARQRVKLGLRAERSLSNLATHWSPPQSSLAKLRVTLSQCPPSRSLGLSGAPANSNGEYDFWQVLWSYKLPILRSVCICKDPINLVFSKKSPQTHFYNCSQILQL